jgi:ankyrin repeat protein
MKRITSSSKPADKMDAFLQGHWPAIPSTSSRKHGENSQITRRARRWADEIRGQLSSLPVLERTEIIESLASAWQRRRQESDAQAYYAAFKAALTGPWQHWQERLLGVRWAPHLRIHHTPIAYNADAKVSLQESGRQKLFTGQQQTLGALAGSSFCQFNRDNPLTLKNSQVLDGAFSATLFDEDGNHSGFVLSLGDGAGGHLGDVKQDRAIGRAAYFASKQAARLLAALSNTKDITSQALEIVRQVTTTITRKTVPYKESTTLIAIRGFWKPGSPTIAVAGFHVGDSLLWYWHPGTEKAYMLAPAKQWESPTGQQATALLPDAYQAQEVHVIEQKLPADGVFFACSDGWYEALEMKVERETDSRLGFIRTIIPDEKALAARLKEYDPDQPIAPWLRKLWQDTLQIQDKQREQLQVTATLATQTYSQNLQALRAAEEKAKSSQSSEENTEPLVALRQDSDYQALKRAVDESAAKLSQSRMGDDVLAIAWAWPRLMPAKIREEIKETKIVIPALSWTHSHIEAYEAQIADLKERREKLSVDLAEDDDALALSQEDIDAQISLLNEQIKYTKKFPNPLYQILRPVIEKELQTEAEITIQEDKLCETIEEMLKTLHEQNSKKLTEMLRQRNGYGDTILTFAIQSKCYRVLQVFLPYVPNDVMLATDHHGQTLLDIIYGQRLVSDDLSARAYSQAGLITNLQSQGVLDQMQWHREPYQGCYPIHIAIQKAVHTKQIDPAKVLLSNDPRPAYVGGPWVSQLQLVDGEGDTPLHVAIKAHALAGDGLPIIKCLLETHPKTPLQDFKNPLYAINRAGQTVFDLAAALRQSNPSRGENVWEELQRTAEHYRQQLLNWGFHQKEEKYSPESMFTQRYQAARLQIPEEASLYDQLYAQYKEFYAPILNNDAKKAEILLEAIEHPDFKQHEMIQQFVIDFDKQREESARCQTQAQWLRDSLTLAPGKISWRTAPKLSAEEMKALRGVFGIDRLQELRQQCREDSAAQAEAERLEARLNELKPNQQRDQAKADFYREILSRAREASFYRTLFAALGPVTQHWPPPTADIQPASTTLILQDDDKEFLQASQQQALQYAKRLAADETQPAVDTLQQLLGEFGSAGKQAEIISCFDFKRVSEADQQKKILTPLLGKSMTQLTLRGYSDCNAVWEGLFQNNTDLQTLELIACGGLRPEHFAQLAKWCLRLKRLVIRGTALTGFFPNNWFSNVPINFPALRSLEFDNCLSLTRIECSGPKLKNLSVHGCLHLIRMRIEAAPRLQSIGCRDTPAWRSLQTDEAALQPLARELKIAKIAEQSHSEILTSEDKHITPLHRAAGKGEFAVVRWLIDQGSSIDPGDLNDQTPLHRAAQAGHDAVIKYLVDMGAGAEMLDNQGRTPLHYAAARGDLRSVEILCATGMNPLLTGIGGQHPVELALFYRKQRGANISNALEIEKLLTKAACHYLEMHPEVHTKEEEKEQKNRPLSHSQIPDTKISHELASPQRRRSSGSAPVGGSALFSLRSTSVPQEAANSLCHAIQQLDSGAITALFMEIKNETLKAGLLSGAYLAEDQKELPIDIAGHLSVTCTPTQRREALAIVKFLLRQGAAVTPDLREAMNSIRLIDPLLIDADLEQLIKKMTITTMTL